VPRFARLPTLAACRATPCAGPKPSTRLARAIAKKAARLVDAKKLRAWAKAVKERDCWKDRRTDIRVRSTRELDPLRAEAHHIVSRDDRAVRYDIRNGITLSCESHDLVERHVLRIEGTAFFEVDGVRYIDATHPVRFVPT
jgi:hypothetical protein